MRPGAGARVHPPALPPEAEEPPGEAPGAAQPPAGRPPRRRWLRCLVLLMLLLVVLPAVLLGSGAAVFACSPPLPAPLPDSSPTASTVVTMATDTALPATASPRGTPPEVTGTLAPTATSVPQATASNPPATAERSVFPEPADHPDHLAAHLAHIRPELRPDAQFLLGLPHYRVHAVPTSAGYRVRLELRVPPGHTSGRALYLVLPPRHQGIYPGAGLEVGEMRIGGVPAAWQEAQPTVIRVDVPAEAGEPPWMLEMTYDLRVPAQPGGYSVLYRQSPRTVLGGWIPRLSARGELPSPPSAQAVGDLASGQPALYDVYVEGMEGAVTTAADSGGASFPAWLAGPVPDFVLVRDPRMRTLQASEGGVLLRYHALEASASPAVSAEEAFAVLRGAFGVLSERFGPYPLVELDVAELPISIGGYEFPALVFVDSNSRATRADGFEFLLVHELTHVWWYGTVGTRATDEPWVDEGLANLGYLLYVEAVRGQAGVDEVLARWREEIRSRFGTEEISVDVPVAEFRDWNTYRPGIYQAGALYFHELRSRLGDEAFFGVLQSLQEDYRFRVLTAEELLRRFGAAAEAQGVELPPP